MARVFISYKRLDKDKVFPLKNQIEAAIGEPCWIDLEGIESDAQFSNVIIRAITSAEIFLFMYSNRHAEIEDYERDWTIREILFAQEKSKRIIFVNIDNAPLTDWFKFMFGVKQHVDGTQHSSIERLLRDLRKWLPEIFSEGLEYIYDEQKKEACVKSIGEAKDICIKIPSKIINNGYEYQVTGVEDQAFINCEGKGIESIFIPSTINKIGKYALLGHYSAIHVSPDNQFFSSIDGVLFNKEQDVLLQYPMDKINTSYTIPDGVTKIAVPAFAYTHLHTVSFPQSVVSIEKRAFYACENLKSALLPKQLEEMGWNAFDYCEQLEVFNNPDSPYYYCFDGLKLSKDRTTLITCPDQYEDTLYIPETVTRIEDKAFDHCLLVNTIVLPKVLMHIDNMTLAECASLECIDVDPQNRFFCSIEGVLFDKSRTTLICFPKRKGGEYRIPNSVTRILPNAFYRHMTTLEISIPNSFTELDDEDFNGCVKLTSIHLADNIKRIGDSFFDKFPDLCEINVHPQNSVYCSIDGVLFSKNKTTLIRYPGGKIGAYSIPDGVKEIGDCAFLTCERLTSVTIPATVTQIGILPFNKCACLEKITVKPENREFSSENGVLFDKNKTELIKCPQTIKGIYEIPSGVEYIYPYAFADCSELQKIVLPESIEEIDETAFENCENLKEAYLPKGNVRIGKDAFPNTCQIIQR